MQKTKLFVTASAVCFALAGAALSGNQSESSSAALIRPVGPFGTGCLSGIETSPASCSPKGEGIRCSVHLIDSWGNDVWVLAWGTPSPVVNLCLFELYENI